MGQEAGQALSPLEAGFLAEVIASPDDDAPRLVYADWLEENDRPRRAELIRLQCRLAALDPYDPGRAELVARERQLLKDHGAQWAGLGKVRYQFRRGFVEEVKLWSSAALRKRAVELFRRHPVRKVRLSGAGITSLKDLADIPQLASLASLEIDAYALSVTGLANLADCPHLKGLHDLLLDRCPLGGVDDTLLEALGQLVGLRSLRLRWNYAGGRQLAVLLRQAGWKLERLHIESNPLDPEGAPALVGALDLAEMRDLMLCATSLRDAGLQALLAGHTPRKLTRLDLSANDLTGRGVEALVASDWVDGLTHLSLSNNPVCEPGVRALVRCDRLIGLKSLALAWMSLAPRALRHLLLAPWLAGLVELDLSWAGLDSRAVEPLVQCPHLTSLRRLDLRGNQLGRPGRRRLRERFGPGVAL